MPLQVIILLAGMTLLATYTAHTYAAFRKDKQRICKAETHRARQTLDESFVIQKQFVADLANSERSTQECVDRWETARSGLISGLGPKWNESELATHRNRAVDEQLAPIKTIVLKKLLVGPAIIAAITIGLWALAYFHYSSSRPLRVEPTTEVNWHSPTSPSIPIN